MYSTVVLVNTCLIFFLLFVSFLPLPSILILNQICIPYRIVVIFIQPHRLIFFQFPRANEKSSEVGSPIMKNNNRLFIEEMKTERTVILQLQLLRNSVSVRPEQPWRLVVFFIRKLIESSRIPYYFKCTKYNNSLNNYLKNNNSLLSEMIFCSFGR